MKPYKIVAVNVREAETQVAYFRNEGLVLSGKIKHLGDELEKCSSAAEQYEMRKNAVLEYLAEHSILLSELDAIATTGNLGIGILEHACWINSEMVIDAKNGRNSSDVHNIGIRIAYDLSSESDHAVALTAKTDFERGDEIDVLVKEAFEKLCEKSSYCNEPNEKVC